MLDPLFVIAVTVLSIAAVSWGLWFFVPGLPHDTMVALSIGGGLALAFGVLLFLALRIPKRGS